MTKKELRAEIKSRLSALSQDYKDESGRKISKLVLSCEDYRTADSIFVYCSSENEPGTDEIIREALLSGKKVYVPKCLAKGIMIPVPIDEGTPFTAGYMGIREPSCYDEGITPEEIDLSIIPCMSAALNGKRLGHGAGFYDRFLEKTKTKRLCLCFHALLSEQIPIDSHDIKMDLIVTEKGIFRA